MYVIHPANANKATTGDSPHLSIRQKAKTDHAALMTKER